MGNEKLQQQILDDLQLPDVPGELIYEIILRLPVKPLYRFQCVSKKWLSLISSPRFITSHFQLSSKTIKKHDNELILGYTKQSSGVTFYTCSLDCLVSSNSLKEVKSFNLNDFDLTESIFDLSIVGTCHGLYCIRIFNDLILWNPSIRKSKRLPQLVTRDPLMFGSFGFAYDEFNDDYVVVAFEHLKPENRLIIRSYSLRANSWKTIHECVSPGTFVSQRSAYLCGNLHWATLKDDQRTWVCVSYNPIAKMLGEIKLPDNIIIDFDIGCVGLGVLRGCLCAIQSFMLAVNIWTMEKYGEPDSWNRISIFRQEKFNHGPPSVVTWVCELEDDGILFNTDTVLGQWSEKRGAFGYPDIKVEQGVVKFEDRLDSNEGTPRPCRLACTTDKQNYAVIESAQYTESLISPTLFDGDQAN